MCSCIMHPPLNVGCVRPPDRQETRTDDTTDVEQHRSARASTRDLTARLVAQAALVMRVLINR